MNKKAGEIMKPTAIIALLLFAIASDNARERIVTLERQNQELKAQLSDLGTELDNIETHLSIDKESVQN